jgi:hypothetical protein
MKQQLGIHAFLINFTLGIRENMENIFHQRSEQILLAILITYIVILNA